MVVSLIVSHIQNDFYRTVTQTEKQVNYNDKKMQANCTTFTEPLHKHRKTSQLQWQKDAGKLYYLRDDCTKRQQICENLIISYTEQLVYKQAWIHHKVFRQDKRTERKWWKSTSNESIVSHSVAHCECALHVVPVTRGVSVFWKLV